MISDYYCSLSERQRLRGSACETVRRQAADCGKIRNVNSSNKRKVIGLALLLTALLAGCGEEEWNGADAQVTTLGIDKEGHVLEVIVEDFAESYYDEAELKQTLEANIAAYIADAGQSEEEGKPITLQEIKKEGTKICVRTEYLTTEDYTDFTYENLYYGTVRQGRLRGYEMPSRLESVDGGIYGVGDADADHHAVFSDGRDHIVTPYKIIAVTPGVTVLSDREADFSGAEGRGAVLLDK